MPKGTCRAEETSNSEKLKPVALAIIELRLSEGISQSVSLSVENSVVFFKSRSNLLKTFWVNLKACLGLVSPHQYCLIVVRENRGWFLGDIISWAMHTPLWSLLYSYYCTV